MSTQQNDIIFEQAQQWLTEYGRTRGDVMYDEVSHRHYIYDIDEHGRNKVYLPERFDIAFF